MRTCSLRWWSCCSVGSGILLLERCAPACSAIAARGRSWTLRAPRTRRISRFESPPFFRQGFQRFMKPYKNLHKCILLIFAILPSFSQFHENRTNLYENLTKYLHVFTKQKDSRKKKYLLRILLGSFNSPIFQRFSLEKGGEIYF